MLRTLPNLNILPNFQEICINECCALEVSIRPLEKYQEIKHHSYHKCHQPFCNERYCDICLNRHGRGALCQLEVHCDICNHIKEFPNGVGCPLYNPSTPSSCFVCKWMSFHLESILLGSMGVLTF